ncbi:hypothetical protein [Runella salmonicolor]|uniref:Uncharacterized protein n=1 Tax=Runella salmonicolor TaxID=2950278 RepID=A0ABT1FMA8_9BACT|nr:hypothetical protein [Runella salmonicolor]MCP1381913.1 hypothetical protein [Runella salmonicolor]
MEQSDPKHYFQFKYPDVDHLPHYIIPNSGYDEPFEADINSFCTRYIDPYAILDEDSNYKIEVPQFHLPYKYNSSILYRDEEDLDEYTGDFIHKLVRMTELDVSKAFIRRAIEYYNLDIDDNSHPNFVKFLNFHYSKFTGDLNQWLDHVAQIFQNINNYVDEGTATLTIRNVKSLSQDWINQQGNELGEELIPQKTLSDELKIVKILDIPPNNQQIKLKWSATNSSLYHLFAQLSEIQTPRGKIPLEYTAEHLAAFLISSFDNLPKKSTIEREIQKYLNKDNISEKKPPKDSINLDEIDF